MEQVIKSINGFVTVTNDRLFFLKSSNKNITSKILSKFIKKFTEFYDVAPELYNNPEMQNRVRHHINNATLEEVSNGDYSWLRISGRGFQYNYPLSDISKVIVIFE